MVLLDPGSAAAAPAVLGWSRPSTVPTLPVLGQPRVVILMLHPGRRRPWLASGAHVKNMMNTLRQAGKLSRAGPDHLLIGTVAVYRMGKRFAVAEQEFTS